ncbi:MAG TPA: hypothetical protein VKX17_04115 [Planctomycetota bacterium]|nr:hypothetical protein [Planctomycetota bacterium]
MSELPRRKWLQVHLSTAVLLMFAAGGLIWLNVTPSSRFLSPHVGANRDEYEYRFYLDRRIQSSQVEVTYGRFFLHEHWISYTAKHMNYGTPYTAVMVSDAVTLNIDGTAVAHTDSSMWVDKGVVVVDALYGLAILFAVWFLCERWIAWRAGGRNSSKDSALN